MVGNDVVGGLLPLALTVREGGSGLAEPDSAIDSQDNIQVYDEREITIISFSAGFLSTSVCSLLLSLSLAVADLFVFMISSCSAPYVLNSFRLLSFIFQLQISAAACALGG